jgi:nucleoside-diphosphate-sugar epimerase
MKIFITGATGFIGGRLASKLAAEGHQVNALVRERSNTGGLRHPNIRPVRGDLQDIVAIGRGMRGCEQVYHCAAYAKLWAKDRNLFYKINLEGTNNILEAAGRHNIQKIVYTSSTAVMGQSANHRPLTEKDPRVQPFQDDYDLSKQLAEQQVRAYAKKGLCAVIVNPSRVYGPGSFSHSNVICRMLYNALRGQRIFVPKAGNCLANYAFIDDVVEGHLLAMQHGNSGQRYILGGENVSYDEFLETVTGFTGKLSITKLPLGFMKFCGSVQLLKATLTGSFPAYTPKILSRYFIDSTFCSDKAINELGYNITPFSRGIEKTINYLKTANL